MPLTLQFGNDPVGHQTGGQIKANNRTDGPGAVFTVTLQQRPIQA